MEGGASVEGGISGTKGLADVSEWQYLEYVCGSGVRVRWVEDI